MSVTHDDDELAAALRGLPREVETPLRLEDRVIRSLRVEGLVGRPGWRRWARSTIGLAAGIMLFLAGMAVGRRTMIASATEGRYFVLLLYEDETFREGEGLVADYTAWARGVAEAGHRVSGEKLALKARLLGARDTVVYVEPRDVTTTEGVLAGYFVVQAKSYEEAIAIARAHPHLRHGGRIVVRGIEPT
ncbi:MAG TPA: YciI family protein [Gemmatimonadales bacterium]